jgi:hypothetical protein
MKDTVQTGTGSGKSFPVLLTPQETALRLKVSVSWLSKARMRGDGPPYILVGRSVRYPETDLIEWMRSQRRLSTSE